MVGGGREAVDRDNDVSFLKACFLGCTTFTDLGDFHPKCVGHRSHAKKCPASLAGKVKVAAIHHVVPMRSERAHGNVVVVSEISPDETVDADDLTLEVEEWASGVPDHKFATASDAVAGFFDHPADTENHSAFLAAAAGVAQGVAPLSWI